MSSPGCPWEASKLRVTGGNRSVLKSHLSLFIGAFEDEDIIHVEGNVDPVRDIEIIHEELRLKDEEMIGPIIDKLEKTAVRGGDKKLKPEYVSLYLDGFLAYTLAMCTQASPLSLKTNQRLGQTPQVICISAPPKWNFWLILIISIFICLTDNCNF